MRHFENLIKEKREKKISIRRSCPLSIFNDKDNGTELITIVLSIAMLMILIIATIKSSSNMIINNINNGDNNIIAIRIKMVIMM